MQSIKHGSPDRASVNIPAAMKVTSLRPLLPRTTIQRRVIQPLIRHYAVQTPGAPMLQVFNSNTKHLQRERAASDAENSRKVDYLRDEVAVRICERLLVSATNLQIWFLMIIVERCRT